MKITVTTDEGEVLEVFTRVEHGIPTDAEVRARIQNGETANSIGREIVQLIHDDINRTVRVLGSRR